MKEYAPSLTQAGRSPCWTRLDRQELSADNPGVRSQSQVVIVLTDAPLQAAGQSMPEKCASCSECVDICPVGAFTGQPFYEDEPRSVRYDAKKCEEHQAVTDGSDGFRVCGLCVYVCPYGRRS